MRLTAKGITVVDQRTGQSIGTASIAVVTVAGGEVMIRRTAQ